MAAALETLNLPPWWNSKNLPFIRSFRLAATAGFSTIAESIDTTCRGVSVVTPAADGVFHRPNLDGGTVRPNRNYRDDPQDDTRVAAACSVFPPHPGRGGVIKNAG